MPSAELAPVSSMFPPRRTAFLQALLHRKRRLLASALGLAAAMQLAGCAPMVQSPVAGSAAGPVAAQWHAPLPHGAQLAELHRWWARFDDPLLLRLIDAGQQANPTVAQATARIADARAARVSRDAALLPTLDATASGSRGRSDLGPPIGSTASAGLQANWELDFFGANRAGAHAARARLEASEAMWHDARVSVAAEIATTYVALRACEAQAAQAELDARSRAETSRLTGLAADAGFEAPAAADLARASAAQGSSTLAQRRAECDLSIKALVALTALDEEALRRDAAVATARMPQPAALSVAAVPAQTLAQRPDIYAAARDVVVASAESVQAQAQRWPRVTLAGSIGNLHVESGGVKTDGTVWSVGPVAVTLPLFDAGTRRANADAARVRYETATVVYAATLRSAVREVEGALVTLQSTAERGEDARTAVDGFERSFKAAESRYRAGAASLFELEDARRSMVGAQSASIELQRDRVTAWIALYRALGGGWSAGEAPVASSPAPRS
ncbi:efflux transporter outer membrane subunit [Rhizobacter sp. Root1221]|uniref:efflux transporter outer membrane subunit n=1 Tax=Rhizobacter sp. Root1221 TaxID=1736433 RepID=UPI000AA68CED|nr:efflux transporter outer membrane subunit [Rhizobacter sp. Root1221]